MFIAMVQVIIADRIVIFLTMSSKNKEITVLDLSLGYLNTSAIISKLMSIYSMYMDRTQKMSRHQQLFPLLFYIILLSTTLFGTNSRSFVAGMSIKFVTNKMCPYGRLLDRIPPRDCKKELRT